MARGDNLDSRQVSSDQPPTSILADTTPPSGQALPGSDQGRPRAIAEATKQLVKESKLPSLSLFQTDTVRENLSELVSPKTPLPDKLIAANELAHIGIEKFQDASGRTYSISTRPVNRLTQVEITTEDGKGNVVPVLNGTLAASSDAMAGHEEPVVSDWAKAHPSSVIAGPTDSVTRQPSEDQLHLLHSMREGGIVPSSPSEADRLEMIHQVKNAAAQADQEVIAQKVAAGHDKESADKLSRKFAAETIHNAEHGSADIALQQTRFMQDLAHLDNLPAEQKSSIYAALERIAADRGNGPNRLTSDERRDLIESIAHQIARPDSIRQGFENTCSVGATEVYMAITAPDKYANIVADLAVRGRTSLTDGSTMSIDPVSINIPQSDGSFKLRYDGDPERSLGSRIFQTAAIDYCLAYRGVASGQPPFLYNLPIVGPTGEVQPGQILTPSGYAPFQGLMPDEVAVLTSALTGRNFEAKTIFNHKGQQSVDEQAFLKLLGNPAHLPLYVQVPSPGADFLGMRQANNSPPTDHSILVTRIDHGPNLMVYYDNTAGGADHSYPSGTPVPFDQFIEGAKPWHLPNGQTMYSSVIVPQTD